MILKRMKRRHLRDDTIRFCQDVRKLRPDMVFGADIIAGFPTETDAMFENSLRIIDDCGLTHLHVFPYSPRPGTPAARMPAVDRKVVKTRAAELRRRGEQKLFEHFSAQTGRQINVLIEKPGMGRAEDFSAVTFAPTIDSDIAQPGEIVPMLVTGHNAKNLTASLAVGSNDNPAAIEARP